MPALNKVYNPAKVEKKWYECWEKKGYFRAQEDDNKSKPYCIVIPPPNITGTLTLGHVLNNTLQDILIRMERMQGRNALWLPGTDHAGIATQNVVEKDIFHKEKKTRDDLGREAFVKRVWTWRKQYGSTIIKQLKMLGCSCDWDRLRFTMDEGYSNAVKEVFIRLYDKGAVYRGRYIINWCPRCHTALSDEENIHQEKKGKLWHIKYPMDQEDGHVVVATTRPETMLGDTAVAVNPADNRYKALIGKHVVLPLAERRIPVIADSHVDREFGTGCVKVTPAHDPNDFAISERHNLEKLNIMNPDSTMNDNVPPKYRKMDRFECRKAVVRDLEEKGFLLKIEDHEHAVGHCERCNTVTEPYLSTQWFVKYNAWIEPALEAVKQGRLKFYPRKWEKTFIHWLENIRDWCISRQLWWGHRIPVWYCGCGELIVARDTPEKCPKCNGSNLKQDDDVLDTWFSSWLWPFATMGWPEETPLLKRFYPTNTLITAADIIFFWVARMVFAGFEFMGKLPFEHVYFNSIVRDLEGRKMSKSLGNSPDPIAVIEKYGADALRYTVVALAPSGQDVLFSQEKCELGRNFANKLWNTARFALMHLEKNNVTAPAQADYAIEDRWILSRYHRAIKRISESLSAFNFHDALSTAYHFTWNEFCDWYLEFIKQRLANGDPVLKNTALYVLQQVLTGSIKLLHPFLPFITEEIFGVLKGTAGSDEAHDHIITSDWPLFQERLFDPDAEACIGFIQEVISSIRNLRAEKNIPPSKGGSVLIQVEDSNKEKWLTKMEGAVKVLSRTKTLTLEKGGKKPKSAAAAVTAGVNIFLDLEGLIDRAVEKKKIEKEIEKAKSFQASVKKKLSNEKFMHNAPEAVVAREKAKLMTAQERIEKLKENLKLFE